MDELFRSLYLLAPKGTYCKTQQFLPQGYTIGKFVLFLKRFFFLSKFLIISINSPLGGFIGLFLNEFNKTIEVGMLQQLTINNFLHIITPNLTDAEICIDKHGKAIPIAHWVPIVSRNPIVKTSNGVEKNDDDDDAAETKNSDMKRIAFQIRDFHDSTLISQAYIGRHALADRHMTKMGYSIIPVSIWCVICW